MIAQSCLEHLESGLNGGALKQKWYFNWFIIMYTEHYFQYYNYFSREK